MPAFNWSSFWDLLGNLDSPLAATTVILAGIVFLWRSVVLELWARSAPSERRRISRLQTALTEARFREVVGREPNAFRELGIRSGLSQERGQSLESRFFVLPRTYVEAFVDQNGRVYGYTVILRRPTSMGHIDVGGVKVRLGRTTFADFWGGSSPWLRPSYVFDPGNRGWAGLEASEPFGFTTGRAWAVGVLDSGSENERMASLIWDRVRRFARRAQMRPAPVVDTQLASELWHTMEHQVVGPPRRLVPLPADYFENPRVIAWRTKLPVNVVSVALMGEVLPEMIDLHSWEASLFDPRPPALARWGCRSSRRGSRRSA